MSAAGSKLTYTDLLAWPEDLLRHELLDGEHIMSPSPRVRHQLISKRLLFALEAWARERHSGVVLAAPTDVILDPSNVAVPDLLFVSAVRAAIIGEKYVEGAPDLLVEILSPDSRRRDLGAKLQLYESRGVAEYWVVDPEQNTLTAFFRSGGNFVPVQFTAAETLTSRLLPGLAIPLAPLFGPA